MGLVPFLLREVALNGPNLRWGIVGLLFLAAVLNYVDKNTLALLAPTIQHDLRLSDQDYARIQNAFQIAYTLALLGSGVVVDRLGPRLSLALFVGWWSLANVLTGLVRSAGALGMCRFMLGLGEAGNWTASPKTVAEWFTAKERGLAIGIYTAGTPVGMTLAPLFIIWLQQAFGWRTAFVVTGLMGLVWLFPWFWLHRARKADGACPAEGPEATGPGPEASPAARAEIHWSWGQILGRWEVWCLLAGRMLSDPVWFFYQNWYPKYLVSVHGYTQGQIRIMWVMFLAAGLGSLAGGWLAGRLIKRSGRVARARLSIMLGCALVMPASLGVAWTSSAAVSIALASLILFAHLAWLSNISALVVDVAPPASLGKVFGVVAAGSSVGAIWMNDFVGGLLKTQSYTPWYLIAAFLHLAAWIILSPLWRAASPGKTPSNL